MNEKLNSIQALAMKESEVRHRYHREHPHFKRNVSMDAFLSSLLAILLFTFISHASGFSRADALTRSGAVALTADELVQHVNKENVVAYWLGPMPGYKYAIICTNRKGVIVSYIPQGVSLNHPDRFNLVVQTFSNTGKSEVPALSNLSSNRDDFVTANGAVVSTFADRPQLVQISIPGTDKYVEVQYPSNLIGYNLYKTGNRLKLISES